MDQNEGPSKGERKPFTGTANQADQDDSVALLGSRWTGACDMPFHKKGCSR